MVGQEYVARNGCYISGFAGGGAYTDMYTLETCASLCMIDSCCKSIDSGVGANLYSCSLNYDTADTAGSAFICDPTKGWNYYEKLSKSCSSTSFAYIFTGLTAFSRTEF